MKKHALAVFMLSIFFVLAGVLTPVFSAKATPKKSPVRFQVLASGNEYCTALHGHAALNLDPTLTYDDLVALSGGACTANLPPSFPVAIDIISRASLDPKGVADPDWDLEDQLRDEGFSESEIDELLAVGFFSVMTNMLTDTYDVPWEEPFPPALD